MEKDESDEKKVRVRIMRDRTISGEEGKRERRRGK